MLIGIVNGVLQSYIGPATERFKQTASRIILIKKNYLLMMEINFKIFLSNFNK